MVEEYNSNDIVELLRMRACPPEGEYLESDHGHSDCYLEREAADEIERLRSLISKWSALINEWVDVQPGRTKADMDRRISVAYDLRKAVGR